MEGGGLKTHAYCFVFMRFYDRIRSQYVPQYYTPFSSHVKYVGPPGDKKLPIQKAITSQPKVMKIPFQESKLFSTRFNLDLEVRIRAEIFAFMILIS